MKHGETIYKQPCLTDLPHELVSPIDLRVQVCHWDRQRDNYVTIRKHARILWCGGVAWEYSQHLYSPEGALIG